LHNCFKNFFNFHIQINQTFIYTWLNYTNSQFELFAEVLRMVEGRCMKCKKSVEIKNAQNVTMKNGRKAVKGVCQTCGTKVFRIVGN